MSDCTHDCSSCGESCGERTAPQDFRAPANGLSHIGKVIAVVSGKGGVGKSLVTSSLAGAKRRMGKTGGRGPPWPPTFPAPPSPPPSASTPRPRAASWASTRRRPKPASRL